MGKDQIPDLIFLLHLTNQCQNRCKDCYVNSGEKDERELTFQEIKQLADTWDKTYRESVRIVLTGGEPTLRKDFGKILELFCKNPKFDVLLFSNGAMIPDYIDLLRKYNVPGAFTLYGLEKTHDKFAQKKGASKTLVKAIQLLDWPVRILVHKDNLDEAKEIANLLKEFGRDSTDCARPIPVGRARNLKQVSGEEFQKFKKTIKKEGIKIFDYKTSLNSHFLEPEGKLCTGINRTLVVSSTGKVFAHCCFAIGESKFFVGDIRKDSWEIIQSEALKLKLNFRVVLEKFGKETILYLYHPMDKCIYCVKCWAEI